MKHFNGLMPAQAERLALLIEELGESLHACGKILRHGYDSCDPDIHNGPSNRDMLEQELGDVMHSIALLWNTDLDRRVIVARQALKAEAVKQWLHHQ